MRHTSATPDAPPARVLEDAPRTHPHVAVDGRIEATLTMAPDLTTVSPTAAHLVVDVLRAHGVDTVFGLPGEENLPVVSALRDGGLDMVVCRHEQHAGFMAVAHARMTGGLGVCLATLGPGALNLFTPLAQAQLMGLPFLAITGQKPRRDNAEGSFQVLDVVAAARPLATDAVAVEDPRAAAVIMTDAIRAATAPPGGAVLIELRRDVACEPVDDPLGGLPGPVEATPPNAGVGAIERLAARIAQAERPLVLAGREAARPELVEPIRQLVETTGLSVLATQMGKGSLDESHPRSMRSLGIHRPDHAHLALDATDLVIAVGYRPTEHPPLAWQQDRRLPVVHVGTTPAAREPGYAPEFDVVGDLATSLAALADCGVRVATAWSDDVRADIVEKLEEERAEPADTIDPLSVVRLVSEMHQPGDVVALDNGAYKIWFARHFPSPQPASLLMDNATASMGAGLATAMEAARLGRRAMAVVGDGGLLMNIGDLETAARLELNLVVLVLRDDAYGFIAWHQDEQDRARHGVNLGNPDLVELAHAFGGDGRSVASVDELQAALVDVRDRTGIQLIDCPIDYRINEML